MTACMRAAGYAYDIRPRKCHPGPHSEWSAFCYRPAQSPWRWLSHLEDSDDPVKIFVDPSAPSPWSPASGCLRDAATARLFEPVGCTLIRLAVERCDAKLRAILSGERKVVPLKRA